MRHTYMCYYPGWTCCEHQKAGPDRPLWSVFSCWRGVGMDLHPYLNWGFIFCIDCKACWDKLICDSVIFKSYWKCLSSVWALTSHTHTHTPTVHDPLSWTDRIDIRQCFDWAEHRGGFVCFHTSLAWVGGCVHIAHKRILWFSGVENKWSQNWQK